MEYLSLLYIISLTYGADPPLHRRAPSGEAVPLLRGAWTHSDHLPSEDLWPVGERQSLGESCHHPRPHCSFYLDCVSVAGASHPQAVMLDSGVNASFMGSELARSLGVSLTPLSAPLRTTSLDRSLLGR